MRITEWRRPTDNCSQRRRREQGKERGREKGQIRKAQHNKENERRRQEQAILNFMKIENEPL